MWEGLFRVGAGGQRTPLSDRLLHSVTLTLSSPVGGMPTGVQPIAFETVALHDPGLAVREKSTFILPTH